MKFGIKTHVFSHDLFSDLYTYCGCGGGKFRSGTLTEEEVEKIIRLLPDGSDVIKIKWVKPENHADNPNNRKINTEINGNK